MADTWRCVDCGHEFREPADDETPTTVVVDHYVDAHDLGTQSSDGS